MNTCERPTAASGDSLGPNIQKAFMSQTRTKGFAAENFTSSIHNVNAKHVFSYVIEALAIFFQCPFRSIQDLCQPYPAELGLCTRVVEITTMEHADQMQAEHMRMHM